MTSSSSSAAVPTLMKGYLPVRLRFQEENDDEHDDDDMDVTYMYVKPHHEGNDTLFVANCPVYPQVSTKLLLTSIFGRYSGNIQRVTVVSANPSRTRSAHQQGPQAAVTSSPSSWTTNFNEPSYLIVDEDDDHNGKFAHVVFDSSKDMKRTWKQLLLLQQTNSDNCLTMDKIELQTLADNETTERQQEQATEEEYDNVLDVKKKKKKSGGSGVLAVAARYGASAYCSRDELLEECNTVMEEYEDREVESRRQKELDAQQPDDDGFITVNYNGSSSAQQNRQLLEAEGATITASSGQQQKRRSMSRPRSRSKKKKKKNSGPLTDFYRFQTKETRKRQVQDLRKKFEDDIARIQKMKDEKKGLRPF